MLQVLLWHIAEQPLLNVCVARIILDKPKNVRAVNITDCAALPNTYYKTYTALEKRIHDGLSS